MTLDELRKIRARLMQSGWIDEADIVTAEIVCREIARDAILDYVEEMATTPITRSPNMNWKNRGTNG